MKIIIANRMIAPFHVYAGAEKYFYHLGTHLCKLGHDVEIVTTKTRKKKKSSMLDGIKYTFIPPYLANLGGTRWIYLFSHVYGICLAKYLSKCDFDVLHTNDMYGLYYLLRSNRNPTICQSFPDSYRRYSDDGVERDSNLRLLDNILVSSVRYLLRILPLKYCLQKSDSVASEATRYSEEISNRFAVESHRIFELPVGVDLRWIMKNVRNSKVKRSDVGLSNTDLVLISVNFIFPEKGIKYLIECLYIIKKNIPNTKLILIGRGSDEKKVWDKIHELNLEANIVHLKDVPDEDLYGYYKMADIYVSPTLQEDYITSINEAMACGLSIVSTSNNLIVEDGVNGYVVGKKNPEALADAVLKMYSRNEHKEMGLNSKRIIKDYSWENIAQIAVDRYQKIIFNRLGENQCCG